VLSRCPAVFFSRPSLAKIKSYIDKELNQDGLIDLFYFYNLGDINTFFGKDEIEKGLVEEDSKFLSDELKTLLVDKSLFKKLVLAKTIDDGDELKEKIRTWILVLYNLLLSKQGIAPLNDINKKVFENLEKNIEYDKIVMTLTSLFLLLGKLETNASKRLQLEDFILQNE